MNIVFVEGAISGLNKAKEICKDTNQFYRYDTIIFKESRKLSELTTVLDSMFLINRCDYDRPTIGSNPIKVKFA